MLLFFCLLVFKVNDPLFFVIIYSSDELPFEISAHTHDKDVFSFFPDERPCFGFSEALSQYKQIVPHLRLSGNYLIGIKEYLLFTYEPSFKLDGARVYIVFISMFCFKKFQVQHPLLQLLKWQ